MRWFTFFCMLVFISIFQSSMTPWINVGQATPDLFFPLVIFYSSLADVKQTAIANWFTGLTKDLFSEGRLGLNAVFFVAVGFFAWMMRDFLFKGHWITQTLLAFIFSVLYNAIYAVHTSFSFHTLRFPSTLWLIFVCSCYTALITPFLFCIFNLFQPTRKLFYHR